MVALKRNNLGCANLDALWLGRSALRFDEKSTARPGTSNRVLGSTVAVLGAGHGGLALAGYLGNGGHRVSLWNRSPERTEPVRQRGGIRLTMPGAAAQDVAISVVGSDLRLALRDARVVLVAVPASGHADIARACAKHLRDGQVVLLLPGRTGGALEFRRILTAEGCRANALLGEANTFPFAARNPQPAEAVIYGSKAELLAASLPSERTADLVAACRPFLPMLAPARSVLHTGLSNVGAILHPTIMLLNANRIQRGEAFDFYTQGVSTHVAKILAMADRERVRIAEAFGEKVQTLTEWIAAAYGHRADTIRDSVGGNPAYVGIQAPPTIHHRYLLEDVPTGLIPLLALSDAAGLRSPTLRMLVRLAQFKLGRESWQNPRTLQSLGLADCSTAQIRRIVATGTPHRNAVPFRRMRFGDAGRILVTSTRKGREVA